MAKGIKSKEMMEIGKALRDGMIEGIKEVEQSETFIDIDDISIFCRFIDFFRNEVTRVVTKLKTKNESVNTKQH